MSTLSHDFHLDALLNTPKSHFSVPLTLFLEKNGRLASEEVTLRLFIFKCIPVLLYGLEAFPLNKLLTHSLDFSVNRFFMKIFKTNSAAIITECQSVLTVDYRV